MATGSGKNSHLSGGGNGGRDPKTIKGSPLPMSKSYPKK